MSDETMNDVFPESKSLKASDLGGKEYDLVITGYEVKTFQSTNDDGDQYPVKKPVLSFAGTDKTFVSNKTNSRKLAAAYGEAFSDWIGKPVTLYTEKTNYKGSLVDGIRIRIPVPKATTPLGSKPHHYTGKTALPDDDIPF